MESARVLVVDDERSILQLLNEALTSWGYQVTTAATGHAALEALKTNVFHVAMTDIRMPDMSGIDLLREIKKVDESIEVVVMTGYPAISSAVEALKEGAYDYLSKPLILDEIQHLMARMMERRLLRGEVHELRTRLGEELTLNELIGASPAMERVKEVIGKVAVTDSPVLVEGESGTGKELVAAAIHRLSARAKRPFIPVNCSAIPGDLLESEFFGHVRGAFTGAVADALGLFRGAHEGTIFLDEIAELPPSLQVKLLRVLQEREIVRVGGTQSIRVNVRLIAATHRDLGSDVAEGRFREDLFFRIHVIPIRLPPLRDRLEDIEPLLRFFVRRFAGELGRAPRAITDSGLARLRTHHWPGNVRELENLAERLLVLGGEQPIDAGELDALLPRTALAHPVLPPSNVSIDDLSLWEREHALLVQALERAGGNQSQAARLMKISREQLRTRMRRYGLLSKG